MGETLGHAVVDTGCPYTVCGETWLKTYVDTLSRKDRLSIRKNESNHQFRFGAGKVYPSQYEVIIPIYVSHNKYELGVDVVTAYVPLLLSRETLRRASAKIDVAAATIVFMGATIPLNISSTGHMCLQISRPLDISNVECNNIISRVLYTSPHANHSMDIKAKAAKLHLQFCHPTDKRLIDLLKKSGNNNEQVFDAIREVTSNCDVCIRNKRAPLRPAVGFPLASDFNETVALDLKSYHPEGYILHIIDHLTRYSSACFISNKRKETIVKAVLDYWIRIFGSPKSFLTDNGGEFVNKDFIDLAEKFNISVKTTAAESAWSNGLCERHNGILSDCIKKVMDSCNCSLQVAVHWAVAAKNSLSNVYGFSPNTLVFGKNTNYPTEFVNKPPANNVTCLDEYLAANLNALHAARKSFIQAESAERIRRAINRKSRTYCNTNYYQGDKVYYWRNDQADCHGPGIVIGKDGQQVLVKHGGLYIRVHPCRLQHCHAEQTLPSKSNKHSNINADLTEEIQPKDIEVTCNDNTTNKVDRINEDNVAEETIPTLEENIPIVEETNPVVEETNSVSEDNAVEGISTVNDDNAVDKTVDNSDQQSWTKVNSNRDLPKVDYLIECQFPGQSFKVRCKVLSKAGKASTANWRYLNIQESDGIGKCCDFKNVLWRRIDDQEQQVNDESQTEETFFGKCTEDHTYDSAKLEEIGKWKRFNTFEETPFQGQKLVTTRWVCTRKIKNGTVRYKARLVARGFEEKDKELRKDSPTCSKESLRIALAIISSYKWKLHSLDVTSAFLQGNKIEREVYIKPPKEANTDFVWKMIRCPYGLVDAGRLWYLRLKDQLISLGMTISKYDQALFYWKNLGVLSGVLICHVDDILYGGSQQFHNQVVLKLKSTFVIGAEEDTNLKYLGLIITQDNKGIHVSTEEYGLSLKEVPIMKDSVEENVFTPEQVKFLKQFCGQLNWLSSQGRPDISFESCYISNSLKSGNNVIFKAANKVVRKIRNQNVLLHFHQDFDFSTCYVGTFCDASFANLLNSGSQGGFISLLFDHQGLYVPITWQSRKIRRVVKSTIGAECLAAVEAAEMTLYLATLIKDIFKSSGDIKTFVFCDNKNLVNAVHSSTNIEDKRLMIDISVLRDLIQQNELTDFLWVETKGQLADTFTKRGASDKLLVDVLNKKLCFDFSIRSFI